MLLEETRHQYEHQIDELRHRLESQQAQMEERLAMRESELYRRSALEFSTLSSEALARQSASLREANRSEMEGLLDPLRRRLSEFQQTVADTYVKENSSRTALSQQIETLVRANAEIGREARRLSNALHGDIRVQGRWGETVLRRMLESAGMIPGVHFILQITNDSGRQITSEEGDDFRPDLLLLLPDQHKVVVDAKVSLTDYLRYVEADDEREAAAALKRHVSSVRNHIKKLGAKRYHRHIKGAMEHTLMFIPNDASFLAAIRGDAEITDYAMLNNVVIISPAHFLSIVQLISQLWRVERQNSNAEAIAEAGGRLYDKYVAFLSEFEKIERNLKASIRAYENCLHQINGGSQSLSARAERLRKMGAKVTRRIPGVLLPENEAPDDELPDKTEDYPSGEE